MMPPWWIKGNVPQIEGHHYTQFVLEVKRRRYLKLAFGMVAGRVPQGDTVAMFPARVLEISGSKAVQVDGDY